MIMMINCFCGMVHRRKEFSLISRWDQCQRSSPSRISDTPRARSKPMQNLSSGLVDWSCAVVVTTTPPRDNRWYYVRDSIRSQILVNTGGVNLWAFSHSMQLSNPLEHKACFLIDIFKSTLISLKFLKNTTGSFFHSTAVFKINNMSIQYTCFDKKYVCKKKSFINSNC